MSEHRNSHEKQQRSAVLPGLITGGTYLAAWIFPGIFGPRGLEALSWAVPVEFLCLHASGILAGVRWFGLDRGPAQRLLPWLVGFYLMFAGAIALGTWSVWPLVAVVWLLGDRLGWWSRTTNGRGARDLLFRWVTSFVSFMALLMICAALPMPEFGFGPAIRHEVFLADVDIWDFRPENMLAFGVLYFPLQAWLGSIRLPTWWPLAHSRSGA